MKYLLVFFLSVLLAACAGPKVQPNKYSNSDKPKYVPVNLFINSGRYATHAEAEAVNYIYTSIEESGLFSRVNSASYRWPHTINITYSFESSDDLKNSLSIALTGATLFVVPTYYSEIHKIRLDVISNNTPLKTISYSEESVARLSLFHRPSDDRKRMVNQLLDKALKDIEINRLIPFVSDMPIDKKPVNEEPVGNKVSI